MSINRIGKAISSVYMRENNVTSIKRIIQNYSNNDWREYVDYDIERNVYTRNKVFEDDKIRMFVSTWKPGYITSVHEHPCGGCWMRPLKGELVERRYDTETLYLTQFNFLTSINTSYIHNSHSLHSVENRTIVPAVSLHVYPKI